MPIGFKEPYNEYIKKNEKTIFLVECSSFFDIDVHAFFTRQEAHDFIDKKSDSLKNLYYVKEAVLHE